MQKKDKTFSKFCEFKALVVKESRKKIRALRSDNGGEYVSQEFKDFCAAEGIRQELAAPHNPQQNGLVERNNRIIVGAVWAMLHDQGIPLHLWAEACNIVVYLHNRIPHCILRMKTPKEGFLREETRYGSLQGLSLISILPCDQGFSKENSVDN